MRTVSARPAPSWREPSSYDVTAHDGTVLRAWSNAPGPDDRPTVLLCNGLGTNPWFWPTLLDPACPVRVISWNHRGTGGSQRPDDPSHISQEWFASDAVAVMDDAGVDACPVMGWSIGVNTMYELTVTHPARVTGLLAVAGVPGDTFSSMLAPLRVPPLVAKRLMVGLAQSAALLGMPVGAVVSHLPVGPRTTRTLTHSGFLLPVPDPALAQRAIAAFLTTPVGWYARLALASSLHGRVSLSAVDVPCDFVAGRYDVLAGAATMRSAAERIDGATYLEVDSSHFLPQERPDVVRDRLDLLLARVGTPYAGPHAS
ncbi:alpha/beta hydrolase [Marmoricola endophyticus]|uniref:Alpha/beta hydrolase n=1 Tax=Marmoricola endophyticus TaxID=2040280 RepID=A0A917BEI0_9ACTN|nr:alpha/beta hydrolase [Marmoricola endophyticus]GGF39637.1 alpha/beta hydrolase [Marmoricola endophyticus]